MKLKLLSALSTVALLSSPAFADDDKALTDLNTWDADSDRMVSLEEWDAAIEEHEVFERIDDNNNGIFDIEESVETGIDYDMAMDLDDGGHIERQEFTVGLFNEHDANGDDMLDESEFTQLSSGAEGSLWFDVDEEGQAIN